MNPLDGSEGTMDAPGDAKAVADAFGRAGLKVYEASNGYLVRLGDNYADYPFTWEAFGDLAGRLPTPDGTLPIVIDSQPTSGSSPVVESLSEPVPHVRITVSPSVPVGQVVDVWVAELGRRGVVLPSPAPWFLEMLSLSPSDIADETSAFLLGEVGAPAPGADSDPDGSAYRAPSTPEPETRVSQSVQAAVETLGTGALTAWEIVRDVVRRHQEYAARRLEGLALEPPSTARREVWPLWRESVAALYDPVAVADSAHEVIDGRLLTAGLAMLDEGLLTFLDTQGAWMPLLMEIDEETARPGGPLRAQLESVRLASGYRSDQAAATDQLGIQGEVNALCDVLLDADVKPPLSVGLFGEWGSGKTFFMDQMRERIRSALESPGPRQVSNVVQIRFNAWHYSDSSLWASLAIEIFERLADPEPVDEIEREQWLQRRGDPQAAVRKSLLDQLETYRTAKASLDAEQKELEARRTDLEKQRSDAAQRQVQAVADAGIVEVAKAVLDNDEVKARLDEVGVELGVKASLQQVQTLSRELSSTSGYLLATLRRIDGKGVPALLAVVGVLLLVATGALLVRGDLLAPVATAIGTVAAALTTLQKYVKPAAEKVDGLLGLVSSALTTAEAVEAAALQQREEAQRKLDLLLAETDREIAETSAAAAALTQQIATTQAQADNLTVGRQLFDFLADRSAGYQKHMGVVGMLHRDFGFLDAQIRALAAVRNAAGDAEPTGALTDLPPIDRVILYVDDLDRCSPQKVLEVLEAIHLLLAMELFVVVVGVDPRWLRRSLRFQYRQLVTKAERATDAYLEMMPAQYLEKIFQIPLTLAPMDAVGFARLMGSLAPSTTTIAPTPAPTPSPPAASGSISIEGATSGPTRALIQAHPGSAAAGGRSLDITPPELAFASALGPLVSSPRAAKRLMNTYRLIRSTQQLELRSRFIGRDGQPGTYQAALLLLAVSSGFPTVADLLLTALEREAGPAGIRTWSAFVAALDPASGPDGAALVPGKIRAAPDSSVEGSAAQTWARLHRALTEIPRPPGTLDDLRIFQEWGSTVARFSFTL